MKKLIARLFSGCMVMAAAFALSYCSIIPINTTPGGGSSASFTVVSPANGAPVGVPFTITGTKSTAVQTVSLSAPFKNAQTAGDSWSITVGSNEVGLGNIQFTLQAKDQYSSVLSNISLVLNVTNNGSTNTIVHIVGQLTNHFTSAWKAYIWDSSLIYGTTDTNGLFDIPVASMRGNSWVGAFRDDNGNGTMDSGEYEINLITDGKLVNVQGTNVSNVFLNIPDVNSRTISGNVTGNLFGLPVGIVIRHSYNGSSVAYLYTAPSTSNAFSYSLPVSGNENDTLSVGYYIDDNNDGKWNYDLPNNIRESSRFAGGISFSFPASDTNSVHLNLCGKMIQGTVTGSGAGDFGRVWADIGGGESITAPVSGGSYSLRFYVQTNEGFPMMNGMQVFIDQNANLMREMYEKGVTHTNGAVSLGDGTSVTTNTRNFVIDRITHVGVIEGPAASEFKLAKMIGTYYDVRNAPYTWTDYMFQGSSMATFDLYAFVDTNANGQYDDNYVSFSAWGEPTNSVVTNKFFILRGIAGVSISGSSAGFIHPMIRNSWQNRSFHYNLAVSHTLTNYWETNGVGTFSLNIFAFDDTNNNGTYQTNATWSEPLIATNSGGGYAVTWTSYVATTNFTLYLTN